MHLYFPSTLISLVLRGSFSGLPVDVSEELGFARRGNRE